MLELQNILMFIAMMSNMLLGMFVFINNRQQKINVTFVLLSLVTVLWIFSNLLFFNLWPTAFMLRVVFAIGSLVLPAALFWNATLIFNAVPRLFLILGTLIAGVSVYFSLLTTYVVRGVILHTEKPLHTLVSGSLFPYYSLFQAILYLCLIGILVYGIYTSSGIVRKRRVLVLVGAICYGVVVFLTALITPIIYERSVILSYDAQSSLFLVAFSTYAILRYHLFDVKVITTELFAVIISLVAASRIFTAETARQITIESTLSIFTVVFAFFLVRSVKREVANREKGEQLARYLANANARLRELDKQKTEFVSVASHQLRAPIAAIKGYASMITEGSFGGVPDPLKEPLDRILESGNRIAIMVDDFLNVTRIEQGRMTYSMQRHEVSTLVQPVVDELRVMAEKKGLAFSLVYDAAQPVYISADEGKLKQIFSNLIDNAIKYTPSGSITVSIERSDTHRAALIKITDTGIGIAPEEQEHLFQKFNRASNANSTNVYGTGLGLYIAREIIKAHNGWIHVSSPGMGKGSTFTVELPIAGSTGDEKS